MSPGFLLDTHIVIWWLTLPKNLSRDQARIMREAARRHEPVAVSDITLLEIALLYGKAITRPRVPIVELLGQLGSSPTLQIIPFTIEIAAELAAMGGSLRDPSDRAIVSTARVHGLRLLTSDQRIIDSGLVPVVI